jgi:hypothetical protein
MASFEARRSAVFEPLPHLLPDGFFVLQGIVCGGLCEVEAYPRDTQQGAEVPRPGIPGRCFHLSPLY